MKKILLFVCLVLSSVVHGQQNHVINGSFEDTVSCLAGTVGTRCAGWSDFISTSDYFNICSGTVPSTATRGYQWPAHGNAYIGILDFSSSNNYGWRESVKGNMIPLAIGNMYEVSLSVSVADKSFLFTNSLCVHFFDNGISSLPSFTATIPFTPKISFANYGMIQDTQNWVRLSATFLADSAYDEIVIGGFLPASSVTSSATGFSNAISNYHYLLIDSVVVKIYDTLQINFSDTLLCAGDTLNIPYISLIRKQSNNTFTIQLSNSTGSFASPVNIGSITHDTSGTIPCVIPAATAAGVGYKIRILSSNYPDTAFSFLTYKIGNTNIYKPVASNNGPVCVNDSIRLFATSSTSGVSYKWTGPSNFISSIQNPVILNPTISKQGNYIVTAYIHGCEAKDTTNVTVLLTNGPSGTHATSNSPVCENDTLKLYGTASGLGITYSWTGPNGFTSSSQNANISFPSTAATGTYILRTDNSNCATTDAISVTIKPLASNFNATYNSPVCEGKQVLFNASSTSTGVTYSWTGPNSFFYNGPSPTIGAAAALHNGNYIATGLMNGCTIKDTVVFSAKPTPATPTVSNNGPMCEGDTLKLNGATTTSGVTYAWAGPNSFTSNAMDTAVGNTHTGMSGNYTLTATLDGCSTNATTAVTVKPLPAAVTLSANSPVCEGSTLQFSATASTTGATYNWSGPNSFTANTQNSGITNSTTAATGWYKMNVGLNGCFYTDSIKATVNIIPATPVVAYNSPICVGETLTMTPTSIAGATYNWIGANGYSSTQQNATRSNVQVADAGQYKVNATLNGCTSPDGTVTVGVNPTPFVVIFSNPLDSICQGNNVLFTAIPNNHGSTPAYRWLVNGLTSGTGNTFNTTTLSDKDIISCEMTENSKCSVPYTDASNDVTMTVLPWMSPSVSVKANPATPLQPAEFVTFTATAANAGINPGYQWKRNGQNIVGATGSVWSANTLNDNDDISVVVTSKYKCPQPPTATSNNIKVRVLTGIKDINNTGGIALYPNPNKGSFVLKGSNSVQAMTIEVVNTMGQVVYREELQPTGANWQKEINMNQVATGTYLLKVKANDGITTMKFNIIK